MSSPGAPDVPQKASSGESLNLLEKVQKGHFGIHDTSIIILAINGGFSTTLPQLQKEAKSNITPSVASRQLQLAAQAPYASFRNLRCMQRKLFKVVTRAGKMRGAWEEELRVGLS